MFKRMKVLFFCASLLLSVKAVAQTNNTSVTVPQQTLVPIEGFPNNDLVKSLQQFLGLMEGPRFEVTEPSSVPATINIRLSPDGVAESSPGTIWLPSTTLAYPGEPYLGADYVGFTHEIAHQGRSPILGGDSGMIEGLASGEAELMYVRFCSENPGQCPADWATPTATCAPSIDQWNNRKLVVYGGAHDFYADTDNEFDSSCSVLTHLTNKLGGDFKLLDRAVNGLPSAPVKPARSQFLTAIDAAFPTLTIDGVRPSTFLNYDVTGFTQAPDGTYFGIDSHGGFDSKHATNGSNDYPFNRNGYNAQIIVFKNQVPTWQNGYVTWSLLDASGKTLVTRTEALGINAMQFSTDPVLNPKYPATVWYQNYPTGVYRVTACKSNQAGTCDNANDPNLVDSDVFPVVNEDLNPGDLAVVTNGPHWEDLSSNHPLTITSPNASQIKVEQYPGLFIYRNIPRNADGSFQDVTLTDGIYIRTFTPDRLAPSARVFKRRDEPILLAFTRATADFTPVNFAVPGGLNTVFAYNVTANDPSVSNSFPLPLDACPGTATNDQGRCSAVFTTADGVGHKSPILYSGFSQLNIRVPLELPIGQVVTLRIVVNGVPSVQSIQLNIVAQDPGVFTIGPGAAAIVAAGPSAGQIVTGDNPAPASAALSIFGTGFGLKMHQESDSEPATGINPTQTVVTATVAGQPAQVLYAGSAPTLAGVDQANVILPSGVQGTVPVVFTVNGHDSAPVMVTIAKQ